MKLHETSVFYVAYRSWLSTSKNSSKEESEVHGYVTLKHRLQLQIIIIYNETYGLELNQIGS